MLLAIAALLALPLQAQAQTLTNLVSNTGETLESSFTESIVAQRVRTGANADGYTISEVDIRLKLLSGRSTSVSIRKNANGEPGDLVATLTNPGNLSPNSLNTFTAPVGTRLNASRSYWITVSEGIPNRVQLAFTTSNAQSGAQGWSIDDNRLYRSSDSEAWDTSDTPLVIAIKGTAGTIASTDATLSDLTLADDDGNAISLTPTFVSATTSYMASVANGIDAVTLTAMTNDSNAMVAITSDDDTTSPGEAELDLIVGSNTLTVTVTAEDGSTTETYTVAVTRGVPVPVDIEPNYDSIGAGLEDLVFTLTREGAATDELEATVTIVQEQIWLTAPNLSHTVTFAAGDDTATLTLAADEFSFDPDTSGNLTATVTGAGIAGDEATVTMISIADPAITVSYDMSSYTFAEDAAPEDVIINVEATLDSAYPRAPSRTFFISFSTVADTAGNDDYVEVTWQPEFFHADYGSASGGGFVARKRLQDNVSGAYFGVENDDVYEGTERLAVNIERAPNLPSGLVQFVRPNGDMCEALSCSSRVEYPVTITDEEDRPVLSLSAEPASLAEEDDDTTTSVTENVSTLTVAAASPKTFATEQTITLTFVGTADYGADYGVSPVDADANATGHQVLLPAETASVQVTVTATTNDTADGDRSILVTGSRDGTVFGTATTITLLDDETTTAATGQPGISGTAAVGQTLTATTTDISDADGKTKAEDGDSGYAYTYQWILVDGNTETDISGETSSTYTPSSSDVGKTIRVKVSFTDDAGNSEDPLTSDATAVVTAVTVAVSIAAEYASIGAGLEDLVFTLTRQGATTDALEATVTIDQDQSWLTASNLSRTVTFAVGSATATLTLDADEFSFEPSVSGDLTATVSGTGIAGGEATVEVVSTADPAITISYDMSSYTFAEDATDVEIYVLATLDPAYPRAPSRSFFIAVSTKSDTATLDLDYVRVNVQAQFVHGDFAPDGNRYVARKRLQHSDGTYFGVENDDVYEGPEGLVVSIEQTSFLPPGLVQFARPNGDTCGPLSCSPNVEYPVTITDEEDRPVLSLAADPASITEEDDDTTTSVTENVSVLTVAAASPKTFATDQAITLTFAGTAVYGTHYSVNPADTDANATGHQVLLPAETASVEVTVTAATNDTADGHRSIAVTGSRDGTAFGTATTITLLDDETTNTAPTVSTVAVTSMAASDNTYGTGEMIQFTVTFDQDVTVVGTPEFEFCLGTTSTVSCDMGSSPPARRRAALSSGSGTTALVFSYTVVAGDMDDNGIWIGDQSRTIKLEGGTIQGTVGELDAVLTHDEVGAKTGHKVNGATANTAATGTPGISGTAQVGQTLTAGIGDIADAEDLPSTVFPTGYTFQWVRVDSSNNETDVGTESITYSPASSDVGNRIKVKVSFTDGAGNAETVTSDATAAVVAAAGPCPAGNDWCTTMTVESATNPSGTETGYAQNGLGALDDTTIEYGSKSYSVYRLNTRIGSGEDYVEIGFDNAVEFLPLGSVFNFGGTEFTADATSEQTDLGQYQWDIPSGLAWIDGQKVTVSANLAPAPESATVDGTSLVLTHAEVLDTASTPAASAYVVKVNGGTGASPSSVSVGARTVTLTLADAVTAADTVTVSYDVPASNPLQDGSGLDAPGFEDLMVTNNTGATNSIATGQPGISGTAAVGQTLTVTTSGITDADGKTKAENGDSGYAYTYQWILVDGNTETDISGETSSTYTPSSSDVGKTIRVRVSFTDDADNAESPFTSEAYPASGTIEVAAAGICGRTLAVRAAILNKISSVSDCANVTDTHLAAITGGLSLSNRNVTALAVGDFAGLDALTRLNLHDNALTTLPAGVFGGLDALTRLTLHDNALTTLPAGVFGGLDALTELKLYNNALTALPAGVFAGLDMLTTLSLSNSGLDALPDGVFAPLTALTTLYLTSNGLATLPAGVFAGLDALTKLRLDDNALIALPAGVFAGLDALTTLWLNDNALTALPAGVFAGLDMLTTLWLDDNALTALPDDVFEPLTALTELKLTNNSRESFAPEAVALPDDGTVSDEGGTVTLDGSGSGGAWGTNVTYGWALTEPASGVTFDDDTSVTPKVTVPSLPEDTELTFTLTVTGRGGTDGILPGTDTAKVRVTRADNTAPTASDSSVTTNEDTAHLFAASDFNFDDTDTGDTLASVTVVTLPTAGVLALNGTAVTAGDTVTKIQLDANQLTFMPAADGNGDAYASFTFRVSDGTDESAADYSMTVNVTAVNDVATGKPTIEGTAQAGKELTATTSGITDVDGNTKAENGDTGYAYTYQWVLVDGGAETDISGETSSTYTPSSSDVSKTIKVKVSFTDDLGSAEGPLTSDATVAVVTVAVSIAAEYASIGAGLEDLVFNLTREGAATDALEATVTIVQDQPWLGTSDLSHTVSFTAGSATATLTLGASRFSFDPETAGNLTATVAVAGVSSGEATVEMVSTADPAITISYDKSSYTFAEDATDVEIYVLATLDTAYPRAPSRSFQIALSTESDTAIFRQDFVSIIWAPQFVHGDYELDGNRFVARKRLQADDGAYFGVLDYDIYEGSERLFVNIDRGSGFVLGMTQFQNPDGTTCEPGSGCTPKYPVFITDEEDRPVLSLSAVPASIAEEDDDTTMNVAENVSVLTVAAASPKTFATEQTITLTFGGTAVYGVHYSVNPADADANTGGHQVLLPAETPSVQVTVTAAGNDTADGHRSILVTGSLDGTEFDRTSVAVADNETTTNTAATGQPMISGTAQVGQMLTATTSGITDVDGNTKAEDGDTGYAYTYQWVLVDGGAETDISGETSSTYTPSSSDVGKKVKVKVTFTDNGGTAETVTSDAYPSGVGTIVAVGDPVNADPVFNDGTSTTRSVAENTAAGTDIGAAVSATDADNDSLEYTLEGADLASFDIVLGTGQLQTKMGVDYNHEAAKNSYSVTVKADDGNGGTDTIAVTVNVTDVDEKAARPAKPTVTATPGTTDSLDVRWTKPDLAGGPEIIGYELQHRITGQGNWNTTTPPGTGTMSTIGGLTTGTEYSVQVRARNGETTSDWSEAGEGTPGTATAAGVTVSKTALTVAEEDTTGDSYTVVLDTRPTASVTVTVGGHSGTDVTPYPATLMFTVLNWDTARTVTVTAGDDVDTANDTVLLTHSATSTDRNYRGIVIAEVTVTVNDNDTARVTVVTGVHLASGPGPDGVWRAGDTVEAVVEFSEAVTVDTSGGEPALAIEFGAQRREAVYVRGSGTAELTFRHVVDAADDGALSGAGGRRRALARGRDHPQRGGRGRGARLRAGAGGDVGGGGAGSRRRRALVAR